MVETTFQPFEIKSWSCCCTYGLGFLSLSTQTTISCHRKKRTTNFGPPHRRGLLFCKAGLGIHHQEAVRSCASFGLNGNRRPPPWNFAPKIDRRDFFLHFFEIFNVNLWLEIVGNWNNHSLHDPTFSLRFQGYPPTTLSSSSAYVGVDRYIHLRSSSQDRGQLPEWRWFFLIGEEWEDLPGFSPHQIWRNVWQNFHHLQSSTNWTSNGATYKQHLNLKNTLPIYSHLLMVNPRESLLHKKNKRKKTPVKWEGPSGHTKSGFPKHVRRNELVFKSWSSDLGGLSQEWMLTKTTFFTCKDALTTFPSNPKSHSNIGSLAVPLRRDCCQPHISDLCTSVASRSIRGGIDVVPRNRGGGQVERKNEGKRGLPSKNPISQSPNLFLFESNHPSFNIKKSLILNHYSPNFQKNKNHSSLTNPPTYKMASVTNSVVTLFTQQLLFYSCARSVGMLTQGPCWSHSHTACCTHGGGVYVEFSHPLLSWQLCCPLITF